MARPGSNRRIGLALFAVVPVMLALSFAAVPSYSWFCRVTGYGGTTGVAAAPPAEELGRLVTVSFDANTAPDMPWEFRPEAALDDAAPRRDRPRLLRGLQPDRPRRPPGRPASTWCRSRPAATSTRSPASASTCRCSRPGERVEMPVTLLRRSGDASTDREARDVTDITLSYTMYSGRPARGGGTPAGARPGSRRRGRAAARRPNSRGTRPWPATRTTTTTSCRRASGRSPARSAASSCWAGRCSGSTAAGRGSR